jgi:uncharacterized membrane protein
MATAPRYGTGRAHGLSDGVFAIAMTLLVLDLKVPDLSHHELDHHLSAALASQGGAYFAYALSFYVVGRLWLGHHRLFRHVTEADERLLRLNLLVLLFVGVLPFPTALLGRYGGVT